MDQLIDSYWDEKASVIQPNPDCAVGDRPTLLQPLADYTPSDVAPIPPGPGNEGDDPAGVDLVERGPLAFVLCEAVNSALIRGADREAMLSRIAELADTDISVVEAVLSGGERSPELALMQAFATVLAIDATVIVDAAIRGGSTKVSATSTPSP